MKQLHYGDNLDVLRDSISSESIDLIYLDPPFNSSTTYNVLFKSSSGERSTAQIEAFEDTWEWGSESGRLLEQMKFRRGDLALFLDFFVDSLGRNALSAYLVMMAARLIELHRVLKPTGSLYLHCDPTASHYLKVILDRIFGAKNFRNEIVWRRTNAKSLAFTRFATNHDVILRYSKSDKWTWNPIYIEHNSDYLERFYRFVEPETGRRYQLSDLTNPNKNRPNLTYEFLGVMRVWRWEKQRMQKAYEEGLVIQNTPDSVPRLKRYLDEQEGNPVSDIWIDISPLSAQDKERLGYPTQKPIALLERIIQASSNPGDVVLDPFCGCGTAVHAAERLKRSWIGIDITHLAISLIEKRLRDAFKDPPIQIEVVGTPTDFDGARDLADRDKYQFQWWACSLVNAQPYGGKKKGADGGIDGQIFFTDFVGGKSTIQQIIVSVKGGSNVGAPMIRDLAGTLQRTNAAIGLFVTLTPPTKPMGKEAAAAGFYRAGNGREYPKIQILTVEGLLTGKERPEYFDMSLGELTYKRARRESSATGTQQELF